MGRAIRYLSVCSGIEAATVAWHPLGWSPVAFAEIEAFPSAVLAHHYGANLLGEPHSTNGVPNWGDITRYKDWPDADFDVLVGGTPCQSFSVAGLRKGLADPRGNLALVYLGIADRYRPEWLVWENVPGVLSSNGGRDFGSILGGMVELGYGFAYRVLDAQYIRVDGFARAVPQRRRRVFVVGHLGDWRRAAAVLFEPESLSGHPPPRREAGKGIAPTIASRPTGGGGLGTDFDASEDGTGRGPPLVPEIARTLTRGAESAGKGGYAGRRQEDDDNLVAFGIGSDVIDRSGEGAAGNAAERAGLNIVEGLQPTLRARPNNSVAFGWAVRRLTPTECERLQGVPDGYTDVPYRGKPAADGPRYKSLGNSYAVNAIRYIGQRIAMVTALTTPQEER